MLGQAFAGRLMPVLMVSAVLLRVAGLGQAADGASSRVDERSKRETYSYTVEWRLIDAGKVNLTLTHGGTPQYPSIHSELTLESTGLVSKLYKVNDKYFGNYDTNLCAISSQMSTEEGRRRRDTRVTYDRARKKAIYLERDLVKNTVAHSGEIDIPACVHDVVGGLLQMRTMTIEPGKSAEIPISDGKKAAMVRVEAQEREDIKMNNVVHKTIRYEAFLMNGVIYQRKARLYVWLTDDARKIPVQIRMRMGFPIGNVTLNLDKFEQ